MPQCAGDCNEQIHSLWVYVRVQLRKPGVYHRPGQADSRRAEMRQAVTVKEPCQAGDPRIESSHTAARQ